LTENNNYRYIDEAPLISTMDGIGGDVSYSYRHEWTRVKWS